MNFTSFNNGHRHTWKNEDSRTSIDDGHSHPINLKKMLADKGNTYHTHKLLKKSK